MWNSDSFIMKTQQNKLFWKLFIGRNLDNDCNLLSYLKKMHCTYGAISISAKHFNLKNQTGQITCLLKDSLWLSFW